MKVQIRKIAEKGKEQVLIDCVEITPEIRDICAYVRSKGTNLIGIYDGKICQFELQEVFYFEALDEKVFAYTKSQVYEMKARLYEVEEAYRTYQFIRCSKSIVLNLMLLEGISPALNGRFFAHMKNGEKIMISRQYVPMLKQTVMGEKGGAQR